MAGCVVLVLLALAASASAHITDLMQSCAAAEDERCRFTDQDYALFHSPEYKIRLFTLVSTGIPFLLWSEIGTDKSFRDVSPSCIADLQFWKEKMLSGKEQALKMMDSSGKYPTASMMKTTATLGDYDQCLSIISAQYCTVELFPKQIDKSVWNSGNYSLDQKVMNQDTGLIQTMCLPADACTPQEVRSLVDQLVRPYLMTVGPGFVTCDTPDSISWTKTLTSLSFYQMIGLAYLLITMWLISCATALHIFFIGTGIQPAGIFAFLSSLSAIDSAVKVFYVKESYFDDPRRIIMDVFKAVTICVTAISHSYAVIGAPLGFYMFDSQEKMSQFLRRPASQTSANEAGIGVFMVLSGFTAFQIMFPLAKAKKLPYVWAFVDRLFKFLPAMAAVVAVELIWPILGSGPLYTRYTEFNLKRCMGSGWANLLLVSNWIESIEMCAPQTYFASLVMQLFLLSLLVTKMLMKSERKGTSLCWILIIATNIWTGVNAWRYNLTPTLFHYYPKAQDVIDHVTAVHVHFASSCSAYFMGFLCGFYIVEKKMVMDLTTWTQVIKWTLITTLLMSVGNGLMIASVCYDLVDRRYSPLFILVNRGTVSLAAVVILFILYSVKEYNMIRKVLGSRSHVSTEKETERKQFSLLAAFHRLALGIFFTNMTVVHYDIFTRRRLITYEIIPIMSRSLFILVSVLVASLLFTILFISPFEKIISMLLTQKGKKGSKKDI